MSIGGLGFSWNALPGINAVLQTIANNFMWSLRQQQVIKDIVLLSTTVDAGNTPTTLLRPGLLLGMIAATGKCTIWDPTATDGSQYLYGILAHDQGTLTVGTAADRWLGYAVVGGRVKAANLLIPGQSTFGLSGKDLEFLVRSQLTQTGRFIIDDLPAGSPFAGWANVRSVAAASPTALTAADNNTLFVGTHSALTTWTLPAPKAGLRFGFYATTNTGIKVASASAGQLIGYNDAAANTVAISTTAKTIGGMLELIGLNTSSYLVMPRLADLAQIITWET